MTIPPRFAANVAWLFTEHAWTDRFAAAADAGFAAVELPWPADPDATLRAAERAGVTVAMVNMPAGDLSAGERGWPNDPARVDEWRDAWTDALAFARDAGARSINVLAGNAVQSASLDAQRACLEASLRWALPKAAAAGVRVVTELLNPRENPRYLLPTLDGAETLLARLRPDGWRLQLDTHHLGLTLTALDDVPVEIGRAAPSLGHAQVADAPGRHEPGSGAIDWAAVGAALSSAPDLEFIGLEYAPTGATLSSLRWITDLGWG